MMTTVYQARRRYLRDVRRRFKRRNETSDRLRQLIQQRRPFDEELRPEEPRLEVGKVIQVRLG